MISGRLRDARSARTADLSLRGSAFGVALADAVDAALIEAFADLDASGAGAGAAKVHVDVNVDESDTDTVVEVRADDDIGLLYRLASAFTELSLDVRIAKVATTGRRVVDVFYVRDPEAGKIEDPEAIERLRAVLVERIAG